MAVSSIRSAPLVKDKAQRVTRVGRVSHHGHLLLGSGKVDQDIATVRHSSSASPTPGTTVVCRRRLSHLRPLAQPSRDVPNVLAVVVSGGRDRVCDDAEVDPYVLMGQDVAQADGPAQRPDE